jgi:hypothetical protein
MWESRFLEKPAAHAKFSRWTDKFATMQEEGDEENVTACVLYAEAGSVCGLFDQYTCTTDDFDRVCQKSIRDAPNVFRCRSSLLKVWCLFFENLLDLLSVASVPHCSRVWEQVKRYYIETKRRCA